MRKKRVMLIFGTRPEAIKLCPLISELQKKGHFEIIVCVSGQHREMVQQVLDAFGVKPDYDMAIMQHDQTLFDISANILRAMDDILTEAKPDMILVQGDTTTAYLGAVSAYYKKIPFGHVEAGLRTYDRFNPFPEEFNRQAISLLADYHFAPTQWANNNLVTENKNADSIYVTGNTIIDALKYTIREDFIHPVLEWAKERRLILLTSHRRESLGESMRDMFRAVKRLARDFDDVRVLFPIHKNPAVRAIAQDIFQDDKRIKLIEPMDIFQFHNIMSRCYLILTDSGGIQEEAPTFGVPVFIMRNITERPEALEAGTAKLVGTEENSIYHEVSAVLCDKRLYSSMSKAQNPFGDGHASERIANIIYELCYLKSMRNR